MEKRDFCKNWEFCIQDIADNAFPQITPYVWDRVDLPHDWCQQFPYEKLNSSGTEGAFAKTGIGWYRKWFEVKPEQLEKRTILYFDGIYRKSVVFINGTEIGGRANGYISFWYDIQPYLQEGINCVAIRVDCSEEPSSRWYNGCGITRPVWMYIGESISIPPYGIQIISDLKDESDSEIFVRVHVDSISPGNTDVIIEVCIKDPDGNTVAFEECSASQENEFKFTVKHPVLWDIDNPSQYLCKVCVRSALGCDETEQLFGIRKIEFIPNKGFYLNGRNLKLKGVCNHHDAGCLGAAVPEAVWRKRLIMLKNMGCNAVRTSHNPFVPCFYNLCDELGLMVMDECFDGWEIPKAKNDYGKDWDVEYERDLKEFIMRDRNHPSIIMWSIGNEVLKMSPETTKTLMKIVRECDNTRFITCGVQGVDEEADQNRALLDVAGYNDGGGACFVYERDHVRRPNQLFVATESPHTYQTRGFYRTQTWWRDHNLPRIEIPNLTEKEVFSDQHISYCSSYDNCGVRTSVRDSWGLTEKYDYLCGEFRWTGFDYLGESMLCDVPSKSYSYGVIDTANFKKDHYYLYQSMWSSQPMLHILPHWTHPDIPVGTSIPVWVYTNCDEAELYCNGKSLGRKEKNGEKVLEWLVPYEPGDILARGYKNGNLILEKKQVTADIPQLLSIKSQILPGDESICEIICTAKDGKETEVPYADCLTGIATKECDLIGSDNGNPLDLTIANSRIRRLFNGKNMYLIEKVNHESMVFVSAILGKRYFETTTWVSLSAEAYAPKKAQLYCGKLEIRYTLDGSVPYKGSMEYTDPIQIDKTTLITTKVWSDGKEIITLKDLFIQGKPDPVVDLAHLNYQPDTNIPAGPFAKEITGLWISGDFVYCFEKDGKLNRILNSQKQQIGYWWYNYPKDIFEGKDYAGTGEIWFLSGEQCRIQLRSLNGGELIMDNTLRAIDSPVYDNCDEVVFVKQQ